MKIFLSLFIILFTIFTIPVHAQSSEYQLPYPGILPDSPFYILKTIRDKLTVFFISDPLKKSLRQVEISDTRFAAALNLIEHKKNYPLAQSTISKGLNYFEEAIGSALQAKSEGADISEITKTLVLAGHKHTELIKKITPQLNKKDKDSFNQLEKRSESLISKILKAK